MELEQTGVVIPAFNAEMTIGRLVRELVDYGFPKKNIIVIDDGSSDRTADAGRQTGCDVIRESVNHGKGYALRRGFARAADLGLSAVVTLDADGQHRVSEIREFLTADQGLHLVIGCRTRSRSAMPRRRALINRTTSLVISLLSRQYFPDVQSGYRRVDLSMVNRLPLRMDKFQIDPELAYQTVRRGYRVGFVPVTTVYNGERSYIVPLVDTARFVNMAVRFLWR